MNIVLHCANLLSCALPVREFVGLRRTLFRAGGISIGRATRLTHRVTIYGKHVAIGSEVWISMGTSIASTLGGRVLIEDNVDIGPQCCLVAGSHEIGLSERRAGRGCGADIVVGKGSWLGASVTVLGGARIGRGSIVAAGSVVRAGSYPDNVLLAGVPATVRRVLNE